MLDGMSIKISCDEMAEYLKTAGFQPIRSQKSITYVVTTQDNKKVAVGFILGCNKGEKFIPKEMLIYYFGFIRNTPGQAVNASPIKMLDQGKDFDTVNDILEFIVKKAKIGLTYIDENFDKEWCPKCGSTQENSTCVNDKCTRSFEGSTANIPVPPSNLPRSTPTGKNLPAASDKQKKYITGMRDYLINAEDFKYNDLANDEIEDLDIEAADLLIKSMKNYYDKFVENERAQAKKAGVPAKKQSSGPPITDGQLQYLRDMTNFLYQIGDTKYNLSDEDLQALTKFEAIDLIAAMKPHYVRLKAENFVTMPKPPPTPKGQTPKAQAPKSPKSPYEDDSFRDIEEGKEPPKSNKPANKPATKRAEPAKEKIDITKLLKNDDDDSF